MLYMVTFTINIPQMLAYMPYMDPMGYADLCMLYMRTLTKSAIFAINPKGATILETSILKLPPHKSTGNWQNYSLETGSCVFWLKYQSF